MTLGFRLAVYPLLYRGPKETPFPRLVTWGPVDQLPWPRYRVGDYFYLINPPFMGKPGLSTPFAQFPVIFFPFPYPASRSKQSLPHLYNRPRLPRGLWVYFNRHWLLPFLV